MTRTSQGLNTALTLALFLFPTAAVSQASPTAERETHCQSKSRSHESRVIVHGKLFASNGGGSGYRVWVVGTSRIVWLSKDIEPPVPADLEHAFTPFDEELYGDFVIVSLEADTPGKMREVCLVSGKSLVARSVATGKSRRIRDGAHE